MKFVCYHTTDPAWTGEHRFLRACCDTFRIDLHTHQITPDSWQRATQFKSRYIRDCLQKFPGQRLVYIDVDSLILTKPTLLESVDADIAACKLSSELLSGVVMFGGGPKCVEVVNRWVALCEQYPDVLPNGQLAWDQRVLHMAIKDVEGARFQTLPPGYNWIPSIGERFFSEEELARIHPVIVATRGSLRINPTHK